MKPLRFLLPLSFAGCCGAGDYVVDNTVVVTAPQTTPLRPTAQYFSRGAAILVLESHHLDRPSEVVGIIDVHVAVGGHDAALAALKEQAVAMGADAVVGAEFHHGDGAGEPIHVSGMAVRYIQLSSD